MHTLDKLKIYLRELAPKGIALAFSGGVDSSLLLAVLKMLHAEAPVPVAGADDAFHFSPGGRIGASKSVHRAGRVCR